MLLSSVADYLGQFDNQQKQMGKPTSDEQRKADVSVLMKPQVLLPDAIVSTDAGQGMSAPSGFYVII